MIRPYAIKDKEALIRILRLNIPQYFAYSEVEDFNEYLDKKAADYFVVEDQDKIIGSGGINYFEEDKLARISWDIIHPDFQGRGIGKELLLYRISEIKKKPAINLVVVRTTQLVYEFYQKQGFKLEKTEKDFWARGFDLYQMKLEINRNSAATDSLVAGDN